MVFLLLMACLKNDSTFFILMLNFKFSDFETSWSRACDTLVYLVCFTFDFGSLTVTQPRKQYILRNVSFKTVVPVKCVTGSSKEAIAQAAISTARPADIARGRSFVAPHTYTI